MSRTLDQWLHLYGESHQNIINRRIHTICVPIIFVTIFFMLFCIPFPQDRSMYMNIATVIYISVLIFWFRLSPRIGFIFLLLGFLMMLLTFILWFFVFHRSDFRFFIFSLILFVMAWIGQLVGHHIEGRKPSFVDDLQFLLIGPIWIWKKK